MRRALTIFVAILSALGTLKISGVIGASWTLLFMVVTSPVWFPMVILGILILFYLLFIWAVGMGLVINNYQKALQED